MSKIAIIPAKTRELSILKMSSLLKQIPNVITVARLILVLPFLNALVKKEYPLAFYLFLAAGLSDGLDGILARRCHWQSYFGAFMDPLADKILMISSFVALAFLNQIPTWLMLMVVTRDIVIMAGVAGLFQVLGNIDFKPFFISKLNTVVQILLVLVLLFQLAFQEIPPLVITILIHLMVVTTVLSLLSYVFVWGKRAFFATKAQQPQKEKRHE